IVWACAHGAYKKLYRSDISKKSYVLSNITFSIPILLPWVLLSGVADLIRTLPFEWPGRFLDTTEGEVTYFLLFLFVVAVIGPAMIQKFWRCKPLEAGDHRKRIEKLCQKADLAYADILYWPIFGGKMITAGVMGLLRKFRYILVTPSLLRLLEPEEIDAVIAHEIGHVKRKHLLFYLLFFVGYMLLSYVTSDIILFGIIYAEPVYWLINKTGFDQTTIFSALFSLVIIFIFLIYFRFIFGYFMRNFERQADIHVYTLFKSAVPLISTLKKIAFASGHSADKPNWHHFSISQRIDYLEKCESDRRWIHRHHRKIRHSIAVFMLGLVAIGIIGYHINFGETGHRLNRHFFNQIIQSELEKDPNNPFLYKILGDVKYADEEFEETIWAYERSLALDPNSAEVLNNLAWLLATCENEQLRNPPRALMLAQQASLLQKAPHILDTLAECYFANGLYREAVKTQVRALEMATSNRAYYEEQLTKFKKALRTQGV
ncbi:MAG: M48 family metalloprotease, partial [Desulfobacterales bacterium]|nr:M48 family metalloprotease [Desulfobacterales bacterium]